MEHPPKVTLSLAFTHDHSVNLRGVSFQATKSPSGFLFVPCTNHILLLSLSWPIWPVCISYYIIPFSTPTCFDFITKETTLLDRIFAIWPDHLSITYYTHPLSSCTMITYSNAGFTAIVTIPTSWINGGPAFGRRLRSGARWWSASTPRCPRCTTPRSGVWRCSCYDALMRSSWPPRCTGWDSGWVPNKKRGNLVKWSWECRCRVFVTMRCFILVKCGFILYVSLWPFANGEHGYGWSISAEQPGWVLFLLYM